MDSKRWNLQKFVARQCLAFIIQAKIFPEVLGQLMSAIWRIIYLKRSIDFSISNMLIETVGDTVASKYVPGSTVPVLELGSLAQCSPMIIDPLHNKRHFSHFLGIQTGWNRQLMLCHRIHEHVSLKTVLGIYTYIYNTLSLPISAPIIGEDQEGDCDQNRWKSPLYTTYILVVGQMINIHAHKYTNYIVY